MKSYKDTSTRKKILDTAQELFERKGYNAFSYRDLSDKVGIKTSSIHYYFPSKGDLAAALVKRYREHFRSVMSEIDKTTDDPEAMLGLYLKKLFYDSFMNGNRICPCSMLVANADNLPEDVLEVIRTIFEENESWIERVLEEGRRTSVFVFEGPASSKAKAIFAAAEGATISACAFNDPERIKHTAQWIFAKLNKN